MLNPATLTKLCPSASFLQGTCSEFCRLTERARFSHVLFSFISGFRVPSKRQRLNFSGLNGLSALEIPFCYRGPQNKMITRLHLLRPPAIWCNLQPGFKCSISLVLNHRGNEALSSAHTCVIASAYNRSHNPDLERGLCGVHWNQQIVCAIRGHAGSSKKKDSLCSCFLLWLIDEGPEWVSRLY